MAGVWTLLQWAVVIECWILFITGSCPAGKFGDFCSYSCHCGHSCNQTTGVCGGGCDEGWVAGRGGTCQKENIAYKKRAVSSGFGNPAWSADKAVDGNRDQEMTHNSCFIASGHPSVWTVDLGHQYRIHGVRIYHRNGYPWRIQSAVLSLSNSSNSTSGVPCYTFPSNTTTGNSVYDVICDGTGQYFTITHGWATLNLCEVEIYVCSRGSFGTDCNHFCHCSDGPCDNVGEICGGDCRPGWRGQNCSIECDQDHYGVNCNKKCCNRHCAAITLSCDRRTGSCDMECLPGWTAGDCTQECLRGTYGQNCSKQCSDRNCEGNSPCDHMTGSCVLGCKSGWMGTDCVEECDQDHYGVSCNETCESRKCADDKPSCDRHTGICDTGCLPGWTAMDCTRECSPGTYGQTCNKQCSDRNCAGNSSCDHVTGSCVPGCKAGWMGVDCAEATGLPQGPGYNAVHLAVAVAFAFVVGAVVSSVVWWRRKRRPKKTSESYNASNARSDGFGPETSTYGSLQAESPHDADMTGETYCTIQSGSTDSEDPAATPRNVSESVGAQEYETIPHTSLEIQCEYSQIRET